MHCRAGDARLAGQRAQLRPMRFGLGQQHQARALQPCVDAPRSRKGAALR